jgi:20S proteasome subunit beta 7
MNPLWNANVIAGVDHITQAPFLAYSDLLGTTYEDAAIATGFGAYLAIPTLRKLVEGKGWESIEEEEAASILEQCLRVLYYRDARSLDKVQMAKVTRDGVVIGEPYQLTSDWSIA